jgi:hypothetical protein
MGKAMESSFGDLTSEAPHIARVAEYSFKAFGSVPLDRTKNLSSQAILTRIKTAKQTHSLSFPFWLLKILLSTEVVRESPKSLIFA